MGFKKRLPEKIAVYPQKPVPEQRCEKCEGYGTTGELYYEERPDHMLMVGVLCEECQGCGGAVHAVCSPEDHIMPDEYTSPEVSEGEWITDEMHEKCHECYGRKWNPLRAVAENEEGEQVLTMKVPCGCAEDIIRTIE